jgi:hypothetical protein
MSLRGRHGEFVVDAMRVFVWHSSCSRAKYQRAPRTTGSCRENPHRFSLELRNPQFPGAPRLTALSMHLQIRRRSALP